MRIIHVIHPGEFGGANTVVSLLSRAQSVAGHRVLVAVVRTNDRANLPFLSTLNDSGTSFVTLEVGSRHYYREIRLIADVCARWRPDVLHSHGYRADVVASRAARKHGIPTVTTLHGFTGGGLKNRVYEHVQRFCLSHFDAVVAVSRPLYESIARSGLPEEMLALVPNAWIEGDPPASRSEARRFLKLPEGSFVIGWVGRLSAEKGVDVFLESLKRVSQPWLASVIGDGPRRHQTEVAVRYSGLGAHVHIHGAISGAARLLPAFDCLVLSSRTEGTPMVLLEAMAAGVPIVATLVGGVPDMLTEMEALLVRPSDPEALARAIEAIRNDQDAARLRAVAAFARLRSEYDSQHWVSQYTDVYYDVVARGDTA